MEAAVMRACILVALSTSAAFAQPMPDAIAQARALNQKGENLFAIAEYDRAIAAFKEAYELAPTPGLLFNIAQAYRLKGPDSCKDAVRFYRNYSLALPDGANREQVDKHLAELEPCPEPATVDAPVETPIAVRSQPAPSRWPHVTLIAGGALATTGGILFFIADRRYRSLRDGECAAGDCPASVWEGDRAIERAGVGLMIAGGAMTIGGAIWLATRPSVGSDTKVTAIAPWVSPSSGGLALGGRF